MASDLQGSPFPAFTHFLVSGPEFPVSSWSPPSGHLYAHASRSQHELIISPSPRPDPTWIPKPCDSYPTPHPTPTFRPQTKLQLQLLPVSGHLIPSAASSGNLPSENLHFICFSPSPWILTEFRFPLAVSPNSCTTLPRAPLLAVRVCDLEPHCGIRPMTLPLNRHTVSATHIHPSRSTLPVKWA